MLEIRLKKLGISMVKFLDLKKQYESIQKEIDGAIADVIKESAFIGGKYVEKFEKEFADYQQAKYCIGVANGTDAIEIAIEALGLPSGSEVIVPANSFIASSEAVTRSGHKVVFCDCDTNNYTISIDSLKTKITDNTKAIVAVHLYGHPCDMDEILNIAKQYNLKVIEDCAQAHGAEYKGRRVGAIGDVGTFSFYPGKNLGAYGDGGAIVTNNEDIAKKCKMIANHGRIEKYNHEFEGRNSRLDGLQAAILSVKLKHLDAWTNRRIELASEYIKGLSGISGIVVPSVAQWAKCVFHLFVVRVEDRNAFQKYLAERSIQTGVHYPISLPCLAAYRYLGHSKGDFKADLLAEQIISLPIGEHLDSVETVVQAIAKMGQ